MYSRRKTIVSWAALAAILGIAFAQGPKEHNAIPGKPSTAAGKKMFVQYCASCHGASAKGEGPAAIAMKTPPPDLTELAKHNDGKYPEGYIGALLKFGRNLASHGSEDMPVWGARFKAIDPVRDPTGQRHIDDLVAYIKTLQAK